MSSILYILNEDLESLLSKSIKALESPDIPLSLFKKQFHKHQVTTPVIIYEDYIFTCIQRDTLYFVSSIDCKTNILETLHYLNEFYILLKNYFNVKQLDKNIIMDNLVPILELIEESVDFGIIQITDSNLMKDYIRIKVNLPQDDYKIHYDSSDEEKTNYHKGKKHIRKELTYLKKKVLGRGTHEHSKSIDKTIEQKHTTAEDELVDEDTYINSYIAKTTIMSVSWRAKGIQYAKNEFFLDVIEKVEYFMDFSNNIIKKNLIHGEIICKSFLSGMPTLKVSLNKIIYQDKQFLSSCKFHQCVMPDSVDEGKVLEFVPPDGDFVLCKYELKRHVNDLPLLKLISYEVKPKLDKYKLKLFVTIESTFKKTNSTTKLNIKIPLKVLLEKYDIDLSKNIKSRCDEGKILFNVSDDFLLWEIGAMKGGNSQLKMGADFALFNEEEYLRQQEELKTSMNPPPLRTGPKLEELYKQIHEEKCNNFTRKGESSDETKGNLIKMDFEIPYNTSSGLKVEYLKIEEPNLQYQAFPWVRYKTISDDGYAYAV
ncbi:hypothetical protein KAFR_0A02060 [Kazachstania africana CBS 2517]|uniref:MHD domain-containing protein n=1 Tax=Kazachstania africana (strain ATCC 22294 / BCRC 22015 / CBS 2517 / CECT 1963 / NBRC 1671 / NRRL Y-8276) TaxID=1071382 RepID=H2AMP4_KAZAF|nr:hypothetical protein KAFR_0A02060 [Kazachstania africana CBS 2517]CCF55644.1 hypothetical protein KAFR_0A02060 [Kazachstania africana CBS 2517]